MLVKLEPDAPATGLLRGDDRCPRAEERVEYGVPGFSRVPDLVGEQGDCMDELFPHDCVMLVDPDMEPVNGKPVLAETEDYGAVVRNLTRGGTHCMLTAASRSGEYPDIIAGPDDAPITVRGRVVWYMRDRDDME